MKSIFKIICICSFTVLAACQNNNKTNAAASDTTKTETIPDKNSNPLVSDNTASANNFSIQVPAGWRYEQRLSNGRKMFFLIGPKELDYTTNMNVLKDGMKGESLDDYIKISLAKMQSMNVTMGPSGDVTVDGIAGKYLKYIYNAQQRTIAVKSYIFPKNDTAYIVTATTIPELGKKYEPIFDKAVGTLNIK